MTSFLKWRPKVPDEHLTFFLRQFATLTTADVPILQSLEVLYHSQSHPELKKASAGLRQSISSGKPLSTSMALFPALFSPFVRYLIYLGEHCGALPAMLQRAAKYKEKGHHFKKQLQQALLYPVIVLSTALIIIMVLLTCILPRFAGLFQNRHAPLPLLTRWVLSCSATVRQHILGLAWMGILCCYFRNAVLPLVWKLPFFKKIHQHNLLSQWALNLSMALKAGAPIIETLETMAKGAEERPYQAAAEGAHQALLIGLPLHKALGQNVFFTPLFVQMTQIGEESGTLEEMLEKISDHYSAEVDYFLANLSHLLEPLIMVVLGVLIGGLVIAMYLPIFKLGAVL